MRQLPLRLAAPDPGWSISTDVCVIGSGVAGLNVALLARKAGWRVTVVTKVNTDDGSTRWAQGGIAAVLDPADTPAAHAIDTMMAGADLCDASAVAAMVTEGPARLAELMARGAEFDRYPDGRLMLTREGGHRAHRIAHAGGDATGAEVQRALHAAINADPEIQVIEHALVLDLLRDRHGQAAGVTLHVLGEGSTDGVGAVFARAVVLATGGMGQIYQVTTNPTVSTGDGVALALRAGATVADIEFVQFHPTALYCGPGRNGQQPLVSEALRGEGAYLLDSDGHRFMRGEHELVELAPRDVVAKAITRVLQREGTQHVYLDARHLSSIFEHRFPTIMASCRSVGIDPRRDLIPVAPAAHYASGGVQTDLVGRTTIPGLYACGEVACTGVHGANRLASNSLLEGLVFAGRIGDDLATNLPARVEPAIDPRARSLVDPAVRSAVARAMTRGAGVLRSADSLQQCAATLAALADRETDQAGPVAWEASNLLTVATVLTAAAARRRETRGCHWRSDYPTPRDEWRGHLRVTLSDGAPALTFAERRGP